MNYLLGVIFAFFDPVIYGGSVIIDNILTNHSFRKLRSLFIYTALMNLLVFSPIFFLLFHPSWPNPSTIGLLILLGIVNLTYKFPFFTALKIADTSVVTGLFSLGRLFVPVLAFFLVGETLKIPQYAGFILIIVATLVLTRTKNLFRPNKAFWLMLLVSFLLSLEGVLFKLLFEHTDWATGYFWSGLMSIGVIFSLVVVPGTLTGLRDDFPVLKKRSGIFLGQGVIDFVAELGFTFSVSLIPISVVKGIAGIQPFFVLIYSFLLRQTRVGKVLNENFDRDALLRKSVSFILLIIGTVMIIWQ